MTITEWIEREKHKNLDLNCAESMLWGANEVYQLGVDPKYLRFAAGFGGGMCCEKDCGVITGMVMVLSYLYAKEKGHNSPEMKRIIQEAIYQFEEQYGSSNCTELKKRYRSEAKGCYDLIRYGAVILDEIIQKNPISNY